MNLPLSVIVPIYNAKQLMFYTVDNLLHQTMRDIELILVDDCSTDDSAALLEKHYAEDKRVRIIRQKQNGGPGEARNRGIEEARGKYVCFCDSDDELTPNALEEMYNTAVKWEADVVHSTGIMLSLMDDTPGDMLTLPEDSWCVVTLDHPVPSEATLIHETPEILLRRWMEHGLHWSVWNKLYRREMLIKYNIRFGKMRLAEDQQFCFNCLFRAERYVQLPGARYYYRQLSNSLSRGKASVDFLEKCLRSGFEISRSMDEFGNNHPWFHEHPQALEQATGYILNCLETGFTRNAWHDIGEESIMADEGIRALFRNYFGSLAPYVMKQCCDAYRREKEEVSLLGLLNSPERLRQQVKEGKLHTLKEYKEKSRGMGV